MYLIYSLFYSVAFAFMLPVFWLRREKYAAGFRERLGNYPEFEYDGRTVIWLHCVSVGETNAARPLVERLIADFPSHRLVVSTTTKTGQELARNIFKDKADTVFYFPFDFKFSIQHALKRFRPSVILLMETEIWPRFFREAKLSGAAVALVNGRLSAKSFSRYTRIAGFIRKVLSNIDLALMQGEADADRIRKLGADASRVSVTGNMKFDQSPADNTVLTEEFRSRFGISDERPLIVAASTHHPEEEWILGTFAELLVGDSGKNSRLLIAPRHPERFAAVAEAIRAIGTARLKQYEPLGFVRRSSPASKTDSSAQVILLDTIGELRAVYPLAEIVFVGGSLIPHGGQSILEPAAAGKAMVTGPYTHNFDGVVREFLANDALIQLRGHAERFQLVEELYDVFDMLLIDSEKIRSLGANAAEVMAANRGATDKTIEGLKALPVFSGIAENG